MRIGGGHCYLAIQTKPKLGSRLTLSRLGILTKWLAKKSHAAGLEISLRRIRRSNNKRKVIYFIHIGKAAGSQIKQAMGQINQDEQDVLIHALTHDEFLHHLPLESEYFFSIRDPISRFRSGFYSRKRRGRPLNDIAWNMYEAPAFARFEHANDLAESLFEPGERGMHATAAMKSIRHTAQDQIDWFALAGDIFTVRPPIWVIRQEHFDSDFDTFLSRAGVSFRPSLKKGEKGSHANNYSDTPELSGKARENLRKWYSQDFAFYDAVETWMKMEAPAAD